MPLITPQDPEAWAMTPAQAVEALKQPLRFGDAAQIKALEIQGQIQQAVEAILKCKHNYERRKELCCCLSDFEPGILEAALKDQRVTFRKQTTAWRIKGCLP